MPTKLLTQPHLEDRDDHAVGRADRQQVHDHGLERHEQRSEHEHQQHEAHERGSRGTCREAAGPSVSARSTPTAVWPPTCIVETGAVPSRLGITSSRSRWTSCGRALVLRRALRHDLDQHAVAVRARDHRAHLRDAGVVRDRGAQRVHRVGSIRRLGTRSTISSGPLKPGPKPSREQVVGSGAS